MSWQKKSTNKLGHWLHKRLCRDVAPDGFTPIDEYSPEDIFVVGFPKSGNTWFQELVTGAIYGVLPEYAPPALVEELVPNVHAVPWYRRHATPMFFKSHALPRPEYRRVIYLLRDGRDAMVSFLHHQEAMGGQKLDFLEFVSSSKYVSPCKWHEHVQAWLANPHQAEMIVIKYEDLRADTARELQRLCDFAGVQRPPEFLQKIATGAAFEKMREKEIKRAQPNAEWAENKLFRRRGKVGSYKDEMPTEVLSAFLKESGDALRRCGYVA